MKTEATTTADAEKIVEDARVLLAATANIAEEKVAAARKRLAAALGQGENLLSRVRKQAWESARAADETIQEHPYPAIAVGLAVGVILGFLVGRRQ